MKVLPIKAVYSVSELARGAGIERRHMRRLLLTAGVELVQLDKSIHVYLSDLELRARPLWEAIKAVQTYARGLQ